MSSQQTRIETLEPVQVARLLRRQTSSNRCPRAPRFYAAARIHGALLFPLSIFDATVLPSYGPRQHVLHCGTAKRSFTPAERRLTVGQRSAPNLRSGLAASKATGSPVIAPTP